MAGNPKTKAQIEAERKRKARSPARPPNVSRADQEKGFSKGGKEALANMTPAQRRAFEKSAKGSAQRALKSDKDDETLKTPLKPVGERYQTRATRTRNSMKDSVKRNVKTVVGEGGAKSIKRNLEGLKGGGKRVETKTRKAATMSLDETRRAADRSDRRRAKAAASAPAKTAPAPPAPAAPSKASKASKAAKPAKPAKAPEERGFFGKLGDKFKKATTLTPGRPRKPLGSAAKSPAKMRKYKSDMKAWRASQESSKAKAGGGRVTVKNPAPKGAIKSALGSALGSGGVMSGARQAAKKPMAKKPMAKKPIAKKPMARTSVKKRMPRRP
jgi:hypothetical protein